MRPSDHKETTRTVVIVEDESFTRGLLLRACSRDLGLSVCAAACDCKQGTVALLNESPDFAILDLQLPDGNALEMMAAVRAARLATKIILLSAHCTEHTLVQLVDQGAMALVDKNTSTIRCLKEAIATIDSGWRYFTATTRAIYIKGLADHKRSLGLLTETETVVLRHIAEAMNDEEIAGRLGTASRTIQTHRAHIMAKLGVRSAAKLMRMAIEVGVKLTGLPAAKRSTDRRQQPDLTFIDHSRSRTTSGSVE